MIFQQIRTLGVGCTALEWFGSYLSGRQQYVRIGAEASSLGAISHVPHCSILGPALFTNYINDLSNIPKLGSLESHIDDSKLYLSFFVKDTCSVVQQINDDLSKIASWCCYNSLLINTDKTKLMMLVNSTNATEITCRLSRHSTWKGSPTASSARDQGLQVDSTLSFDEHITNTVSSCLGSLCKINRVRHFLGTRTLGNVINALVIGKLHYLLNQPI